MKTIEEFKIIGASVLGTRHLKLGRNNQDSYTWIKTPNYIIAIVCDGCSSGAESEVGSKIVAPLFAQTLANYLSKPHAGMSDENFLRHDWLWHNVRQDVLARIRVLAQSMDENLIATICKYFLCTVIGCVITPTTTCIFGCGDGIYYLNGTLKVIGPFSGNQPPYLAYGITGSHTHNGNIQFSDIHRHIICPTDEVESVVIGTDGVEDLEKSADQNIPGREEKVGLMSQFWTDELYFSNPEWMRNVLTTLNTEKRKPLWKEETLMKYPGLLPDDTTLIVLKNKKI